MTPRYRCAFCGSFSSKTAKEVRDHMKFAWVASMERIHKIALDLNELALDIVEEIEKYQLVEE